MGALVGCQPASVPNSAGGPARSGTGMMRTERREQAMPPATAEGEPYDFYLLNLSWSPEFCATHPNASECSQRLGFIVHGLWPQNLDGSYPQHCGSRPGPSDARAWTDLIPNTGLVRHEWQTHGTCTPYDADTYFGLIRRAFQEVKIPPSFAAMSEETMLPPVAILDSFAKANPDFPAGSILLSCGNNRLTAIEVCLAKDLQPTACQGVRSCRANAVKITPRQQ